MWPDGLVAVSTSRFRDVQMCLRLPVVGTVLRGCDYVGVCWFAATFRAAFAVLFNMKILHAAAAPEAATLLLDLNNFAVTSEAATEYMFNMFEQHAAAASADALRGTFNFAAILGDVFESAPLVFWIWFSGMLVICAGSRYLFGGKVSLTSLGKGQKDFNETSRPSDLQASTQEDGKCLASDEGELHLYRDHVNFKGKDRHDTDGSLSLGLGKASGRVDVPVSVNKLIDSAFRSPQSVVVNQSLRVEKNIFVKGVDGRSTIHRVSDDMMIGEILADWMVGLDVMISFNGKVIGMYDTVGDLGIGRDCTLRCSGRVRGGAQRYRQPQPDIPGQWTCSVCFQERVWPVRNRCFRCGAPKGRDPAPSVPPYVVGPTGRQPRGPIP